MTLWTAVRVLLPIFTEISKALVVKLLNLIC